MNNNGGWWGSFNPPDVQDPNASSARDDWKFSFATWGLIAGVIGVVIWLVTAIL